MPLVAALALLVLATGLLANPTPGAANPSLDSEETQFLALINNYRASQNPPLQPLQAQVDLNEASDWYATDMATKNYFGDDQYCAQFHETAHCDSLGRMPPARAEAFGYPQGVGENSAAGNVFDTAQSVFDAWKASSGHNANMLGSSYRAIGIGRASNPSSQYGTYWVTDFGSYTGPPSSSAPTPSPTPKVTPQSTPTATPAPTPTPARHTWDDVNCDGAITAEDAIDVLRGGAGFPGEHAGCPSVGDLVFVGGAYHVWGDTDCIGGVAALDGIQLLEYVAGLSLNLTNQNCPAPGAPV
jgi:uncharacterized protein YkwD